MKLSPIAPILILILVLCSCAPAHKWTKKDSVFQGAIVLVSLIDYGQTKEILSNPKYKELNPLITEDNVDEYFAISILAHAAVSAYLSPVWRTRWQALGFGLELGCVYNNFRLGVNVKY